MDRLYLKEKTRRKEGFYKPSQLLKIQGKHYSFVKKCQLKKKIDQKVKFEVIDKYFAWIFKKNIRSIFAPPPLCDDKIYQHVFGYHVIKIFLLEHT